MPAVSRIHVFERKQHVEGGHLGVRIVGRFSADPAAQPQVTAEQRGYDNTLARRGITAQQWHAGNDAELPRSEMLVPDGFPDPAAASPPSSRDTQAEPPRWRYPVLLRYWPMPPQIREMTAPLRWSG